MSPSGQFSRITIAGGGAVGAMFARLLSSAGVEPITIVDQRRIDGPGIDAIQADVRRPSARMAELAAGSDLVILALPEEVAIEAAAVLGPAMRRCSLLVDTLSVKSRYVSALSSVVTNAELLGINPMFAPSLGFSGRSLIAVPYSPDTLTELFLGFIAAEGCDIVRMDAERHDRACASLQALTHAAILTFGLALKSSDLDLATVERIMPPPHRTLLALLARILNADPEVYRDIQVANPYALGRRAALADACRTLEVVVASEGARPFVLMFEELRSIFAASSFDYAALCESLFTVVPDRSSIETSHKVSKDGV